LKHLLLISLLFLYGNTDKILQKTLACPSVVHLQKAVQEDVRDPLKIEMYAIANDCVILNKNDTVKALGYDPRNSKEMFQQILLKKMNQELYILRSTISVEQGGKKSIMRF